MTFSITPWLIDDIWKVSAGWKNFIFSRKYWDENENKIQHCLSVFCEGHKNLNFRIFEKMTQYYFSRPLKLNISELSRLVFIFCVFFKEFSALVFSQKISTLWELTQDTSQKTILLEKSKKNCYFQMLFAYTKMVYSKSCVFNSIIFLQQYGKIVRTLNGFYWRSTRFYSKFFRRFIKTCHLSGLITKRGSAVFQSTNNISSVFNELYLSFNNLPVGPVCSRCEVAETIQEKSFFC